MVYLTIASTAYAQSVDPNFCAPSQPLATTQTPTPLQAASGTELPATRLDLPTSKPAASAWDITLEVQDPRSLDLELEVYDRDPKIGMPGDPLCVGNQPGSLKRCRVSASRLKNEVWIRPTSVGTGQTDYRVAVRALTGPAIGQTELFAADARPTSGRAFTGTFEPSLYARADSANFQQLYCVSFTSSSMRIQLQPTRGAGLFTLSAFGREVGSDVRLLSETSTAQSNAFLFVPVPPGIKDGFVLIRLEGNPSDVVGFGVSLEDLTDWRGTVGAGYVYRTLLPSRDYDDLNKFARCFEPGATPDPRTCEGMMTAAKAYEFLQRVAWGLTPTGIGEGFPRDPIVVFLGIDQQSTTLLIEPTSKDQFADPKQTVLRSNGALWTVYIEDDNVQFETFASVRFSRGEQLQEFILERPGSRESIRATAGGRVVRIGVKRFQTDRLPVNAFVTFSREGPNYPRQGWSRTYRFRDRSPLFLTFGLTVVGNDVHASYHQVVLTQREFRVPPSAEAEIVQVNARRYLFGAAMLSWPRIRATCAEDNGSFWLPCNNWRAFVPNVSAGIGIPMEGPTTYMLAANWPISGMDALQFTIGVAATEQQKLFPEIQSDTLIPRTTRVGDYLYQDVTYTPVIGLTVDFGVIARQFR